MDSPSPAPPHKRPCTSLASNSSLPPFSAAFAVLTSHALVKQVSQFQRGIRILLHELTQVYDTMKGPPLDGRDRMMSEVDTYTHQAGRYYASAMRSGDLAAVQLVCRMEKWPELRFERAMALESLPEFAAACGRLDVLKTLKPPQWGHRILSKAVQHQQFNVAWWLLTNWPDACSGDTTRALEAAAGHGNLALMCELMEFGTNGLRTQTMDAAARGGHEEVVYYLHQHSPVGCTYEAIDFAAASGNLQLVQFLHQYRIEGCSTNAMDHAAARGHLDIVQFLHESRVEGCTTEAMDEAASNGHFVVVQYLHQNRAEGCTTKAMDKAAGRGDLRMVQFLHFNRREGCTIKAMDCAAQQGHLEIVAFLHENRPEGCSTASMDGAAGAGHLQIVEYLHTNRYEGCSKRALTVAVKEGHVAVVKFLHETRGMPVPKWLLSSALREGKLEVVRYLHEDLGQPFYGDSIVIAKWTKNTELVEYVAHRIRIVPVTRSHGEVDPMLATYSFRGMCPWCCSIGVFQDGVPLLLRDPIREYETMTVDNPLWTPYPQYLLDATTRGVGRFWGAAMRRGDLAAVQIVSRLEKGRCKREDIRIQNLPEFAALCGRLNAIQWLHTNEKLAPSHMWNGELLANAVIFEHDELAWWLLVNRPQACQKDFSGCLRATARYGNVRLLQELIAFNPEKLTPQVMDAALAGSPMEVIRYLHEHSSVGCTKDAMDSAASNGRLDVVQFLHEQRREGCTHKAMDLAAARGHLPVVQFLQHIVLSEALHT